ncbi:MAG: molecular chaperone HtpG, partial [Spirochaetaceae bacterium]
YITGGVEQNLRTSPLLEMYRQKDIEVLIMDDEIDEIVIPAVGKFGDLELKSVNRSDAAADLKTDEEKKTEKAMEPLVKRIAKVLKDEVKEVRASVRLSDSPSCVVADENDPTFQMQHLLKAMGQKEMPDIKPILEINPTHPIVKKLEETKDETLFEDTSRLLFEQAMLIEGAPLKNPAEFAKRLNRVIEGAL